MVVQFAQSLSLLLSGAARPLLEGSQPPARNPCFGIRRSYCAKGRWTALVAFMLLAGLLFLPTTASAIGAGSGSRWLQTNAGSSSAVQADNDFRELELGKPVERELVGGQHHSYQVTLSSGQFLHAVVEPHGIGVTARLFGPDSKLMMTLGVMAGSHEPLFLVAKEQGIYHIEIRSGEGAATSSYELRIAELRVATSQDSNLALAESALAEGEQLDQKETAESQRKGMEKYEQALRLWRAAGDRGGDAETLYDMGSVYEDLGENQKALDYYNQALPLLRAVEERAGEGVTLNRIGFIYHLLGENQKALDYFNQALALQRAVGDRGGEGWTLNDIGLVYNSLGENQKALDYYNQALPLRRAAGDHAGEGATLDNLGSVYHSLGKDQQAFDYYNQAIALARAAGNSVSEGTALNGIGSVYHSLAENQKALDYYNQALALRRAVGKRVGESATEGATLNNMGAAYQDLGEGQKALDSYDQALAFARTVGNRTVEGTALNNLGLVYWSLGENQKALDYFNQALALRRAVGNRGGEGAALNSIGLVYQSLGENQKALDHYNQALAIRRTGPTLNNIGWVYLWLGENQKALDYFNQALAFARTVGNRRVEGTALDGIGVVYHSLGENQKALDYLNQALALRRAAGNRVREATTLKNIARVEQEQGNLAEALAQIEAAIKIIESLRTKVLGEELRASYFSTVQSCYTLYIDVLMRLHHLHPGDESDAEALEASERRRARSLLETLGEAQVDIRQGVDPVLLQRERSLKLLLKGKGTAQVELLNGQHTEEQAAALKKDIEEILSQYEQVEGQIRVASPRYAALTQPQPLRAPEIQQQLDGNTLLLEYSLGDQHSYLWAVGPDSLRSFQLPKGSDVAAAARGLYELLTARNRQVKGETEAQRQTRVEQAEAQYPQAAQALSNMVLGSVASLLKGKRLVIVADGALQYIPFSALPEPGTESADPSRGTTTGSQASFVPLVVGHEIISLPSVSALAVLRRETNGRQGAPKMVAVLADPVFDSQDPRVQSAARNEESGIQRQVQKGGGTRGPEETRLPIGFVGGGPAYPFGLRSGFRPGCTLCATGL